MLSPEELAAFERDGFVGPFRLFDEAEIAAIREGAQAVLDDPVGPPWAYLTMDAHVVNESIFRLATDPRIVDRVTDIVGENVLLWKGWTFSKKPGAGATGVHRDARQDQAWPELDGPVEGTPMVGVWIALDPATVDNGCMWVVPGSAFVDYGAAEVDRVDGVDLSVYPTGDFLAEYGMKNVELKGLKLSLRAWSLVCALLRVVGWGQRAWFHVARRLRPRVPNPFRAPRLTGLTMAEQRALTPFVGPNVNLVTPEALRASPLGAVPLECEPGEFFLFREDLIHTAPANRTDSRRAALAFGYASPACRIGADRYPVLVRGEQAGENRIFTPTFDPERAPPGGPPPPGAAPPA